MQFQPSSYGDEAAASTERKDFTQYVPALRELLFGESAREDEAVIRAKIQRHRQQASTASIGLVRNYHLNEAAKLTARLSAISELAADEERAAQTTRVTRAAVTIGSVLGVVLLGAVILSVAKLSMQQSRLLELEIDRKRR